MSAIEDAIHSEAEEARDEIRAAGVMCPSCGVNMADLPHGHMLDLSEHPPLVAQCAAGQAVELTSERGIPTVDFATFQAAANIHMWDAVNAAMDEEFSHALGWDTRGPAPEAGFTGFLASWDAG